MYVDIIDYDGMKILFKNMANINSITFQIITKSGSIYENKTNNGISHFLEHVFFKGTKNYPNAEAITKSLDEIGADYNAFTGEEYCGYRVKTAPEYIEKGIDIISDMIVNPIFPEEELEKEKGVIIQEIMMYEDMPNRKVIDDWKRFYYGDNSYGWEILGNINNINSFTKQQVEIFKNSLYTKDNTIIIITGSLKDKEKILNIVKEKFKNYPKTKSIEKPNLIIDNPIDKTGFTDKKTSQNHLIIGCKGYSQTDKEKYAMNMLGVILGGNMSSILFQEIREKLGLCYYIGASHYSNEQDGIFLIRAGLDKKNFEKGIEKINEIIEKISDGEINNDNIEKAKAYIIGKNKIGIETSEQMNDFIGEQYFYTKEIENIETILEKYKSITKEEIVKVAKNLSKENLYTYYIK